MADDKHRHYHLWPDSDWGCWLLLIVLLLCLWDCMSGSTPDNQSPIAHAIAEWIRS